MRLKSNYLWCKNNNCAVIIALMLKGRRYSVLKSYFNYAFIAPKKDKTQSKFLNEALITLKPEPNLKSPAQLTNNSDSCAWARQFAWVFDHNRCMRWFVREKRISKLQWIKFPKRMFFIFFLPLGALAQVRIFIKPHQRKTSLLVLNALFSSGCWNTSTVGSLNSMKN